MNIVHCIDDRYVAQCGVTMTSICVNNMDEKIHFHVLTNNLSFSNREILRNLVYSYKKDIVFYDVDERIFDKCPVRKGDHVSLAAYFRILMPNILPKDLDKVLYLDCDLIICRNTQSLWNTDISSHSVGAVYDGGTDDIRTYNRLKYDIRYGYFNSGVLLVNLSYWREYNISDRLLDFINKYPERLLYWDQDALNSVLIPSAKVLPFEYNMQDAFYVKALPIRESFLSEIDKSLKTPTILHFSSPQKPWLKNCDHPLKYFYFSYLERTPWAKKYPIYPSNMNWKGCLCLYLWNNGIEFHKKVSKYRTLS